MNQKWALRNPNSCLSYLKVKVDFILQVFLYITHKLCGINIIGNESGYFLRNSYPQSDAQNLGKLLFYLTNFFVPFNDLW